MKIKEERKLFAEKGHRPVRAVSGFTKEQDELWGFLLICWSF